MATQVMCLGAQKQKMQMMAEKKNSFLYSMMVVCLWFVVGAVFQVAGTSYKFQDTSFRFQGKLQLQTQVTGYKFLVYRFTSHHSPFTLHHSPSTIQCRLLKSVFMFRRNIMSVVMKVN